MSAYRSVDLSRSSTDEHGFPVGSAASAHNNAQQRQQQRRESSSPNPESHEAGIEVDISKPLAISHALTHSTASTLSHEEDSTAVSGKSASTTALIGLVKQQVEMVKSLTNANKSASEELRRVQEEKRRMEEELARTREEMAGSAGEAQQQQLHETMAPPPPPPPPQPQQQQPQPAAFALGAVPEDRGGGAAGATAAYVDSWVPFAPPAAAPAKGVGLDAPFDEPKEVAAFDEWSAVVYPSSKDVAAAGPGPGMAVAMPVGVEAQLQSSLRKSKKKAKADHHHRHHRDHHRAVSSSSSSTNPLKPKTIPLVSTDAAPPLKIPEKVVGCESRFWASFSWAVTFYVPDCLICRKGAAAKQAWREKVAICLIALLVSAFFVGVFGFVPLFFCTEQNIYTWEDIYTRNQGMLTVHKDAWTVIHGRIYDVKDFIDRHPGGGDGVRKFLGRDASKLFPRIPADEMPSWCLNPKIKPTNLTTFTKAVCADFDDVDELMETPCHNFTRDMIGPSGVDRYMGQYFAGTLAHTQSDLKSSRSSMAWIIIKNRIYNMTAYLGPLKNRESYLVEEASPNAFLNHRLHKMIVNKIHQDATEVFEEMYGPEVSDAYLKCLDDLYFAGVVDSRDDPTCYALNIVMYVMLILVLVILVLQFLCSLLYVARASKTLTTEMAKSKVMVMVPCYNEGDKELRKTIKSVVEADYPDDNKVLFVVADGLITGRGENCSTPETVASILGYQMDKDRDASYSYTSIGASTRNKAFVYSGIHERDGRILKYVVVVKCGTTKERPSPRAGNRGKRDSQLILAGTFNRVHYGRELCDLDVAICRALGELDISVEELKYLMTIDADTRVHKDSMARMVYSMEKEDGMLACSGETRVDNKAQSWVTVVQVYEYFSSHHMKKAFESVFGCVTCLPGCFTMYRVRSVDGRPLVACDNVFGEYSRNDIDSLHEKNLYHLGEDRMLTTLLLKYFADMKLSFVPEAVCWTIVPHTFRILLSQRRRWINSTFHNMWELLKVDTMCGVCVFSMKTVVLSDMISTMILPASIVYAGYFIYTVFVDGQPMSQTLFIIYGVIIGCQMLVFLIRSRWDYFFWFFAYMILGVPIFFFILPVYSFWNMDDLSWGQTRQVAAENAAAGAGDVERDACAADPPAAAAAAAKGRPSGSPDRVGAGAPPRTHRRGHHSHGHRGTRTAESSSDRAAVRSGAPARTTTAAAERRGGSAPAARASPSSGRARSSGRSRRAEEGGGRRSPREEGGGRRSPREDDGGRESARRHAARTQQRPPQVDQGVLAIV